MAIKGDMVGKYITGCDILIPDCNIAVKQPTVKTILQIGEGDFFSAVNFIAQTKNMLMSIQAEEPNMPLLSELQLFLMIYHREPHTRIQLDQFFELVFPQYGVKVTENCIEFRALENDRVRIKGRITPFNYEPFQTVLKELFLPYNNSKDDYNPVNAKAAEIAEKLKKGKQKIAEQRNEVDNSLFGSYISILSIGLAMDINTLMECTPFQLYDMFMRYNRKTAEDRYFKLCTIPFADSSKLEAPDSWVSNLYN